MWGWSPADGTFGTGTLQYLKAAKRQGMRIVCVDPRRTMHQPATGRRAHLHQPVDRCRRADRDGLRDRERGSARPGLSATATCWASTRRTCRRAHRRARRIVRICWATVDGVREDAGMGRGDHRHPGRDAPPAGDRVRHHQAGGAAGGYAPGRTALRRAVPSRRLRARGDHRQCRHRRAATRASSNGATGRAGIQSLPTGRQSDRRRGSRSPLLADLLARGKAGGYPADIKLIYSSGGDLFNQCPNVNKMRRRRSTAWSSSSCRTTS